MNVFVITRLIIRRGTAFNPCDDHHLCSLNPLPSPSPSPVFPFYTVINRFVFALKNLKQQFYTFFKIACFALCFLFAAKPAKPQQQVVGEAYVYF